MPKTLTSIRLSEETQRKISQLLEWWGAGTTKTEVITIAIDRLYQEEARKRGTS